MVIFERAAKRLKLSGRRREIGRHYFLGMPVKEIRCVTKVPEGTMKRDILWLHARVESGNRAEFVHRIYENGTR
jgi:hypothetical protein